MANLVIGSTYRFQLTAQKDGVAWNLTAAVVKLYLRKPDGTVLTKTATVTNGVAGIAEFVTATTDIDVEGGWTRDWEITDGAVVQRSLRISFTVDPFP